MTYAGPVADDAPGTRTGGVPHTSREFEWPRCRQCAGPMQFLAQVSLADIEPGGVGLLSLFMCQNDPGLCGEWDPTAGGNRAFLFESDTAHTPVPPDDGETLLGGASAVACAELDGEDYPEAGERWHQRSDREVLGQLGGRPAWVQDDETPTCGTCGRPMAFVVQLEEGHDRRTAANFGGGCGYAFCCRPCTTAAFLFQC